MSSITKPQRIPARTFGNEACTRYIGWAIKIGVVGHQAEPGCERCSLHDPVVPTPSVCGIPRRSPHDSVVLAPCEQDVFHMWHPEGSPPTHGEPFQSDHAGKSRIWPMMRPWNIWTSTLIDSQPYHQRLNELEHDHCTVQQNPVPYSGVLDMEVMPGPTMIH
jgi:hypothetical protein